MIKSASACASAIAKEQTQQSSPLLSSSLSNNNDNNDNFAFILHADNPVEHFLGGPRHDDAIVRLAPLDLQRSARQLHRALAVRPTLQHGCHDGGARPGAARQRGARPPLPHVHLQVAAAHHLGELGVGLGREHGVRLEARPDGGQVELGHLDAPAVALPLAAEGDAVRVAHAHGSHQPRLALHLHLGAHRRAVLGHRQIARHLGGRQHGLAHVHGHLAVGAHLGLDQARQRAHLVLAGRRVVDVGHEVGEAADAVAAHLRLGAVGVVHAHGVVLAVAHQSRGHREDHAVGADAKVAVA
mmetsp:Transcript_14219/g.34215  ORF Transcript_14219/g.34215 Transcript_14219/m.34215 type:complete len:299 (-) Transcript_14219:246-1142(-)